MDQQQLDRLESKVDKTIDAITDISLIVAKMEVHIERNAESLEEHMRRTEVSELRLDRLEKVEQWIRGAMWVTLGIGSLVLAVSRIISSSK